MKRKNGGLARPDAFVLELASLRHERRLLKKTIKSWTRRARNMLLRKRTRQALEEKARREHNAAS